MGDPDGRGRRAETLNCTTLAKAPIIIEEWRKHYSIKRLHSALGYRPPAPETIVLMDQEPVTH